MSLNDCQCVNGLLPMLSAARADPEPWRVISGRPPYLEPSGVTVLILMQGKMRAAGLCVCFCSKVGVLLVWKVGGNLERTRGFQQKSDSSVA